jgi:hypothetical protein
MEGLEDEASCDITVRPRCEESEREAHGKHVRPESQRASKWNSEQSCITTQRREFPERQVDPADKSVHKGVGWRENRVDTDKRQGGDDVLENER